MPTLREFFLKIRDRSKSLIKNQSKNLYSQSKSTYNKVLDTEVGDIKKGAVGAADLTVKASKSLLIYIYMAGLIMIAIPSGIFLLYLFN